MNLAIENLGRAQERIQEAAQFVAEVANRFTGGGAWGTQRMDYLTQALNQLNSSWSLVRAATNDSPVLPSVSSQPPVAIHKSRGRPRRARRS